MDLRFVLVKIDTSDGVRDHALFGVNEEMDLNLASCCNIETRKGCLMWCKANGVKVYTIESFVNGSNTAINSGQMFSWEKLSPIDLNSI